MCVGGGHWLMEAEGQLNGGPRGRSPPVNHLKTKLQTVSYNDNNNHNDNNIFYYYCNCKKNPLDVKFSRAWVPYLVGNTVWTRFGSTRSNREMGGWSSMIILICFVIVIIIIINIIDIIIIITYGLLVGF